MKNVEGNYEEIIDSISVEGVRFHYSHGVRDSVDPWLALNVGLFSVVEDYHSEHPSNNAMNWKHDRTMVELASEYTTVPKWQDERF